MATEGTPGLTEAQREAHKRTPESNPDHIPYCIGFIEGAEWGAAEARAPLEEQGRCETCGGPLRFYVDDEDRDEGHWGCPHGHTVPVADREEAAGMSEARKLYETMSGAGYGGATWGYKLPHWTTKRETIFVPAPVEAAIAAEARAPLEARIAELEIEAARGEHYKVVMREYRDSFRAAERQRDEALAALHKAEIRIGILLGRMWARDVEDGRLGEPDAHSLSLFEGEGWIEEMRALNPPASTAAEEPTE